MNEHEETARGLQAPPERDATLRAAILRIGASLDLYTVLREVVDGARPLTGARYGVITTVDGDGEPRDFVTSGFSPDEHRAMEAWPDGLRLFGHLRELSATLRLPDLDAWIRSRGCSPFPVPSGAFQATPMRHRGAAAGGFFLGGKEGGFTDADEEMLVLFAHEQMRGFYLEGSYFVVPRPAPREQAGRKPLQRHTPPIRPDAGAEQAVTVRWGDYAPADCGGCVSASAAIGMNEVADGKRRGVGTTGLSQS